MRHTIGPRLRFKVSGNRCQRADPPVTFFAAEALLNEGWLTKIAAGSVRLVLPASSSISRPSHVLDLSCPRLGLSFTFR